MIPKDLNEQLGSRATREAYLRQHHELKILFDISSALHSSTNLHDLLERALMAILETLKFKMGAVYLVKDILDDQWQFELAANYGFSPALVNAIQFMIMPGELMAKFDYEGPVRWVPVDRLVFSPLRDRMREEGVRELICVSLMTQKKVLGLLYVTNDGALRLKHERTEFLKVIGHQLGVSIENALLFESVERARSELEITFDAIQHSIFLIDKRMRIYRVNKTCELVYREQGPLLGQKYTRVLYGQDQPHPECPIWACLWGGQPVQREGPHPRWGGYYHYYAFPVFGSGGLHRVVYYEKDETESRRMENRLQQTERLKALGTLAAGIAHEIRNPLATINFNTQMLQRELVPDTAQAQMFQDTIQEVRKIDKIVQQVLHFARPADPQFLPYQVNDLVTHCHDLARVNLRDANVEVVLDLAKGLPDLVVDFNQICQVIMNVILNGIDAMSGKGRLTIRTTGREDPPGVIVRISDTGPGILPEDRERIFDPFYTRKPEGTGLGLSISSQILEKHGAYIEIEESSPLGTTFEIVFPLP